MPPRLESPRLVLEPLAPAHADALHVLYRDPEVARHLLTRPRSREAFQELFERTLAFATSHGMWAVRRRDAPDVLGRVGFLAHGAEARPELAFLLAASAWGRGYATEACRAALGWALEAHPWSEVVALVRPENAAAMRVVHKLGFAREADVAVHGAPAQLLRASRAQLASAAEDAAGGC